MRDSGPLFSKVLELCAICAFLHIVHATDICLTVSVGYIFIIFLFFSFILYITYPVNRCGPLDEYIDRLKLLPSRL